MRKTDLSVATMTWARNADEAHLVRAAMSSLATQELPTFITDGGSPPDLLSYLKGFPKFYVAARGQAGVVPQTMQSLREAYATGSRFVLYTESDKQWFFAEQLSRFLTDAPDGDDIGIVLAARSPDSIATYPATQQYCESVSDRLCAEHLGLATDYFYGPLILNRRLIPYMDLAPLEVGWGWRPFLCGVAHRLGLRLVPWVADLPCPREQRADTPAERLHRMRQLSQNIHGLVLALSTPEQELDRS